MPDVAELVERAKARKANADARATPMPSMGPQFLASGEAVPETPFVDSAPVSFAAPKPPEKLSVVALVAKAKARKADGALAAQIEDPAAGLGGAVTDDTTTLPEITGPGPMSDVRAISKPNEILSREGAPPVDLPFVPGMGVLGLVAPDYAKGIARTGADVMMKYARGIKDPLDDLYDRFDPNSERHKQMEAMEANPLWRMLPPDERQRVWEESFGKEDSLGPGATIIGRLAQTAMNVLPAMGLSMAAGANMQEQLADNEAMGLEVPGYAKGVERVANAPWEALHGVGGAVGEFTGSEGLGMLSELAVAHGVGVGGKKIAGKVAGEIGMRRALATPPDAAMLDALQRQRTMTTVQPSLANAPPLEGARIGRTPPAFVRNPPPTPQALPVPETALAPVPPSTHYVGPGAIQSPIRVNPGAPLPVGAPAAQALPPGPPAPRALPEVTPSPGVIVTPGTAETAPTGSVTAKFSAKGVGAPTAGTGADPGLEATPPGPPPVPVPTTPISTVEGVPTAKFGGKGAKTAGTATEPVRRFGPPKPRDILIPPAAEGTVPIPSEVAARAAGPAEGQVAVSQADGSVLHTTPEKAPAAQAKAAEGKLADIVNGEGTSPKPAAPTEIVTGRDASGAEVRSVLVDTPEKRASAEKALGDAGLTVETKAATPENVNSVLEGRKNPRENRAPVPAPSKAPVLAEKPTSSVETQASPTESKQKPEAREDFVRRVSAQFRREGFTPDQANSAANTMLRARGEEIADGALVEDFNGDRFRVRRYSDKKGGPKNRAGLDVLDENGNVTGWREVPDAADLGAMKEVPPAEAPPAPSLDLAKREIPSPAEAPEKMPDVVENAAGPLIEWPSEFQLQADGVTAKGQRIIELTPEEAALYQRSLRMRKLGERQRAVDDLNAIRKSVTERVGLTQEKGQSLYNEAKALAERARQSESPVVAAEPPASPPSTSGTSTLRVPGRGARFSKALQFLLDNHPEEAASLRGSGLSVANGDIVGSPEAFRASADRLRKIADVVDPRATVSEKGPFGERRSWVEEELRQMADELQTRTPEGREAYAKRSEGFKSETPEAADARIAGDRASQSSKIKAIQDYRKANPDAGLFEASREVELQSRTPRLPDTSRALPEPTPTPKAIEAPVATPRPGKFGAKNPRATGEPGSIGTWPVAEMELDPQAMQFREKVNAKGETGKLREIQKPEDWRTAREGIVTLWRDPKTGRVLVEDGHQRVNAAKRSEVPDLTVRFSEATTAEGAKLEGAIINLSAESGTAYDFANLFRQVGKRGEELKNFLRDERIPASGENLKRGQALANLSDPVWDMYRQQQIPESRAIAIGESGATPAQQLQLVKADVPAESMGAYARRIADAGTATKTEASLFGAESVTKNLFDVEAKLETSLVNSLKGETRIHNFAAENAEGLKRVGKIDKGTAKQIASETGTLAELVEKELRYRGPLRDAVARAAQDIDAGRVTRADAVRRLRSEVVDILKEQHPEVADALPPETAAPTIQEPTLFKSTKAGATEPPKFKAGPEKPKGREGPTLGVGLGALGKTSADVGKIGEAIDKPWRTAAKFGAKKIGEAVAAAEASVPGVTQALKPVKAVRDWFPEPRSLIGKEFAETMDLGEGRQRVAREEGNYFHKHLGKELKGMPEADRKAVYEFLGSESDVIPASATPAARKLMERGIELVNEGRDALVALGRLSPEARAEFKRYLVREMQSVELGERYRKSKFGKPETTGSRPRLPERHSRQDAYETEIDLGRGDIEHLLSTFKGKTKPKYIGEQDGSTLVKFEDSPAGKEARDAFENHVRDSYATARRDLNRHATAEMKASDPAGVREAREAAESIPEKRDLAELGATPGEIELHRRERARLQGESRGSMNTVDVRQAKMLHKASLETPRAAELNIRSEDPLSLEMRSLMGEDTDPASALARTIANVRTEVAKVQMLEAVKTGSDAKRGAWVIEIEPGQKPSDAPPGYEHVSNKRLGALDNTFVHSDIAADLKGSFGIVDPAHGPKAVAIGALDVMTGITDGFKTWWTIRNPAGHVQNALSAPVGMIEAGVSILNPANWPHITETIDAIRKPDPFNPMQREIIERGIDEGAHLGAYELGMTRDAWNDPGTSKAYKIGRTLTDPIWWSKRVQDADLKLGRAYNFFDRVQRQSAYRKLRAEGLTPEAATIEVNEVTTNYAKMGKLVKAMRHLPFSPFIAYSYGRLNVLKNNIVKHPTRAAVSLFGAYALKQLFQSSEVSDEEKEGIDAEYGKSRFGAFGNQFIVATGRNEDGSPRVWDTGSLFTVDRLIRGPKDMLDESALESTAKWLVGDVAGFRAGPAWEQAIEQWYGRNLRTGKEMEGWDDRLDSAATSLWAPYGKTKKVIASFEGKQYTKSKPPISPADAFLDVLLHLRFDAYTPTQSIGNTIFEKNRAKTDIRKASKADMKDALEDDPEADLTPQAEERGAALEELGKRFGRRIEIHSGASEKTPVPK